MTKRQKAIDWVREHPDAGEREAMKAGISKSTWYLARSIVRGKPQASVVARMRGRAALAKQAAEAKAEAKAEAGSITGSLTQLTEILKDLQGQGVTYLHFEDGKVEIRTTLYHKWEI